MEEKILACMTGLFVGATNAGKTALIKQWVGNPFEANYRKTVGMDYFASDYTTSNGKHYWVSLWDVSGAKDYLAATLDMIDRIILSNQTLEAIVIVLDGSQDEALVSQLSYWLDVVLKQPSQVPIYFFINKIDLIEELDREDRISSIRATISQVVSERKWSNGAINSRGFSVYFCSAKTGEGVPAAFDALFSYPHRASTLDDVVSETFLFETESLYAKSTSPSKLTLFFRRIGSWCNNIKKRLIQHKLWMGGNLLIFTAILAMITITLLLSVGSVLMPAWALTLLLGNIFLSLWYVGWGLYQHSQSDRENAPKMSDDEPSYVQLDSPESRWIKENRETWLEPQPPLLPRPHGFRTPSASSSPSTSDDERDSSNPQNSKWILL